MNTLKTVFTRLKKEESKKIDLSLVEDINNVLGELDFGYNNIYASTDKLNPARPSITEPLFGILDGINSEIKNLETAVNEVSTRIGIYRNYSEQFIEAGQTLGIDIPENILNYENKIQDYFDSVSWGKTYIDALTDLSKAIEKTIYDIPV